MCGPPPFLFSKYTHIILTYTYTLPIWPQNHIPRSKTTDHPAREKTETDLALIVCHSSPLDKVATSDPYHTQAHAPLPKKVIKRGKGSRSAPSQMCID